MFRGTGRLCRRDLIHADGTWRCDRPARMKGSDVSAIINRLTTSEEGSIERVQVQGVTLTGLLQTLIITEHPLTHLQDHAARPACIAEQWVRKN